MPSEAAERRRELFRAARAGAGELVRLDPGRLRFSLGTSLADVRVPVRVAPDAAGIVRAAAGELALLLVTQHREFVPTDDLDRILLAEGYATLPAPAPTLGPSGGGVDLRAAASLGAASHPALLGGILCAWMGPGGRGRSLTAVVIEALRAALEEAEDGPAGDQTPLVVALALGAELQRALERVREVLPSPPVERYLGAAASTGLWIAARTGALRAVRAAAGADGGAALAAVELALSPAALLGGRAAALGGSTLYGPELGVGAPRIEELAGRLAAGADPDAAADDLAAALAADGETSRRAEAAVAVARLRAEIAAGVAGAEAAGHGALVADLRALHAAPGALAAACHDEKGRGALALRLEGAARLGGEPGAALDRARSALRAWRPRDPASAFGVPREEARAEYALAASALACDLALERLLAPARRALVARTGGEFEGGADVEWQEGRLYRVSARGGRILEARADRPLGHLFADVKDFTRRTGLLGPAAMAEFLRSEFYRPILAAAKGFFAGMPHLADRGGIAVNNLLGDAISFSGDVEALVALAGEIPRLLAAYEARLAAEVSSEAVARRLAAIDARYAADLARVAAAMAAARATGTAPGRLEALTEEEARLVAERERALARARGEGLEAGVFLSYGGAPVTVVIDDEVFGPNRVAIADKINESARGTARAPAARARADAALAEERVRRGNPLLPHAWRVFVDAPLGLALPAAVERAALERARSGDSAAALRLLAAPVKEALERAARAPDGAPGDLYNGGAALSEEALAAFLAAVKAARQVRRVELRAPEIPQPLAARAFYGERPLELVACYHPDGRMAELFRRAGTAAMKGLGDVVVWERAAADGPPAALFRHFARAWLGA
ncbi:MAG TPA: hypothetical protein VFP65_25685 [Anaeromyxobacteraceae bacterium]|nr:hypothetical protein [Anaeromyxobacteraceae bacterium]